MHSELRKLKMVFQIIYVYVPLAILLQGEEKLTVTRKSRVQRVPWFFYFLSLSKTWIFYLLGLFLYLHKFSSDIKNSRRIFASTSFWLANVTLALSRPQERRLSLLMGNTSPSAFFFITVFPNSCSLISTQNNFLSFSLSFFHLPALEHPPRISHYSFSPGACLPRYFWYHGSSFNLYGRRYEGNGL